MSTHRNAGPVHIDRPPMGRIKAVSAVGISLALVTGGVGMAFAQGGGNGAMGSPSAAAVGSISCPDAVPALAGVAVPASARAEVDRNLALLQTQVDEANARLRSSVGQGGPNFVRNAILGPLADKRVATLNRIATAIGRQGTRPQGLDTLAPCSLAG